MSSVSSPFSSLPERLSFGGLIALAARQWRRAVDAKLQRYELTEATWVPLLHLARAARSMRQRDLAAVLALDSSSVVRVLKQLEAARLIERGASDEDRRAKALVVTPAGRELAGRLEIIAKSLEHDILSDLPAADMEATRRVLTAICARLLALNALGDSKQV